MEKDVTVWYDQEGDYLEILFARKEGYFVETENDAIMEKIDSEGNGIGFSSLKVSVLKDQSPLSITLKKQVVKNRVNRPSTPENPRSPQ